MPVMRTWKDNRRRAAIKGRPEAKTERRGLKADISTSLSFLGTRVMVPRDINIHSIVVLVHVLSYSGPTCRNTKHTETTPTKPPKMAPEDTKTTTTADDEQVEDVQPQAGEKRKADDVEEEVKGDEVKKQKVDLEEENEGESSRTTSPVGRKVRQSEHAS